MVSLRSLDARSIALGAAVCAGLMLVMAQSAPGFNQAVRVQYGPHPRDMVQIKEGIPFVVPAGRILVVTGLGDVVGSGGAKWLIVNGQNELSMTPVFAQTPPSVAAVPTGLTFSAGSVCEVLGGAGTARAYGYLSEL